MKYLKPIVLSLLTNTQLIAVLIAWWFPLAALCVLFAVPIAVLIALPFARWDIDSSNDSMGQGYMPRGDLPGGASWLGTPNERLPGGTYEPTVASVYARFGRFVCSWYWLGMRNQLYGLGVALGRPATAHWPVMPGYYEDGDLWFLRYPLFGNRLQLKAGYRIYQVKAGLIASPCCTITKA